MESSYLFRLLGIVLAFAISPGLNAQALRVAIISSSDAGPYRQVTQGFEQSIRQARAEIEFIHLTPGDDDKIPSLLKETPPALVLALGSESVRSANEQLHGIPMIATMILGEDVMRDVPNATAIRLDIPILKQLQWHQRFLPETKRVGILYNPMNNQDVIDQAKASAVKLGLEVIAIGVKSPHDIASALKELGQRADSILGIPDKTVYSSSTAKAVLLYSFRNRIPFVGLSSAWVKAGALYTLDWDYSELGRQCAASAMKILDGAEPVAIGAQAPGKSVYQVNMKTAKHMKLEFSRELIESAEKVYD